MKKMKWLASVMMLVVAATMFSACSDDSSSGGSNGYVNATVNGTEFKSTLVVIANQNIYNIIGKKGESQEIELVLPLSFTTGAHAISSGYGSDLYKINYYANLDNSFTPVTLTSGTITITSYDASTNKISGTFTGTATNLSIVSGEFSTNLIVED
jgi:hypothetical protein